MPATRAEIVERARAAAALALKLRQPIVYRLGRGGFDPTRHAPWNALGECDCSGFAAWALKQPRENSRIPGGWIETTMVYRDATSTKQMFRVLASTETPEPGDLMVYGDSYGHQGHIGVVSGVIGGKPALVIHCSVGNDRTGPAIQETDTAVFTRNGAIVVRAV